MELNFWNILKIIIGIYLIIATIRFLIGCAGIFFANLLTGIIGCILGWVSAILLKSYLIPTMPKWYIIGPVGALLGCMVNNIISQGFTSYLKNNLYTLWDVFKMSFFFIGSDGSSTSSTTRTDKAANNIEKGKYATRFGEVESGRPYGACSRCTKLQSTNYCTLKGTISDPDNTSCESYQP